MRHEGVLYVAQRQAPLKPPPVFVDDKVCTNLWLVKIDNSCIRVFNIVAGAWYQEAATLEQKHTAP
jgi:hypothetical protein